VNRRWNLWILLGLAVLWCSLDPSAGRVMNGDRQLDVVFWWIVGFLTLSLVGMAAGLAAIWWGVI
jgi:hypothetical protein